ncbi:hypothetical protein B0I37DRAFT_124278 [Chaetomium sp. MPI-CAGE-AT-0009]|nr:hypothetical protein B0I37DRAFT_124278 [Chaetomium sp. MPI-CAGE-AT-0009]
MSFKKFKAHISTAAQKAASGGITGVLSVANGDSDGEVVIIYHHNSLPGDVRIQALAQNVSEYPDGNTFMLWTDDPDPPPPVVAAIRDTQDYLIGMSVYEMVTELGTRLNKEMDSVPGGGLKSPDEADEDNEADDYDAAFDTDYPSDGDEFGLPSLAPRPARQNVHLVKDQKPLLQRIRRDLRQVKNAGYKIGFLDSFGKTSVTGHVAISIRVDKLALSDEVLEAWDIKSTEYIVLILRFEKPYSSLDQVMGQAAAHTQVVFRIGKCKAYKPSLSQALASFSESNRSLATDDHLNTGDTEQGGDGAAFEKFLVSNSLDSFLCESFVSLLKIRQTHGTDWEGANEFLLSRIGFVTDEPQLPDPSHGGGSSNTSRLPEPRHVLGSDHLLEGDPKGERSFPLIAMQFAMRYFVKCTEYCLRCHRRLEKGFEALRPYVCSDPLCLFQYMAMGFGPSIEHEILTEPYVVDLLVSLCYAAIQPTPRAIGEIRLCIRSLPVGLRLRVPDLSNASASPFTAAVAPNYEYLVFEDLGASEFGDRLAPTRWLAFRDPNQNLVRHARVREVNSATKTAFIDVMGKSFDYRGAGLSGPGALSAQPQSSPPVQSECRIADVYPYDTDFDSLDDMSKGSAMRYVLDTLPSILDIEEWLASHPHSTLRSMERVSPAAASLLQWIVSSNRSCIFQVDRSRAIAGRGQGVLDPKTPDLNPLGDPGVAGKGRNREHERILGMEGWVQFRFAQGSPDKELRFNRALQEVVATSEHIKENPTIFAWHGSHLANWHSIVRTGLDFQDTNTGRAYGNGVYFSPSVDVSMSYSRAGQSWPNSDLNIGTCLSLNEIINAPEKFVCNTPHYVVSQLDWHQCRYLFVRPISERVPPTTLNTAKLGVGVVQQVVNQTDDGRQFYPQARGREVRGQKDQYLQIPLAAIPLRAVGPSAAAPSGAAKRAVQLLEDSDDDQDAEDLAYLFSDGELDEPSGPSSKKPASCPSSIDIAATQDGGGASPPTPVSIGTGRALTDFGPGALDLSTIPRLPPPSFATDAGTKTLSRELKRMQTVQSQTPPHELGWHMDFDSVSNLFQWIVQLHSFDASLPLAQDLKQAGLTSVVLELRFPPDFPFSPPFVRVVRPRFLPFLEGGGGHVTAGGAMCMELLTASGWSPANGLDSVLLQVRMALASLEPRPARLDPRFRRFADGKGGRGSLRARGLWR